MPAKRTRFTPLLFTWPSIVTLAAVGFAYGQIFSSTEGNGPPTGSPLITKQRGVDQPAPSDQEELGLPGDRKRMREMALLDRLLSMLPEQLTHLRQTIERVENMSAEERKEIRRNVRHFRHLPPRERSQMFRNWEELSEKKRTLLQQHWEALSHEERRARRMELKGLGIQDQIKSYREVIYQLEVESREKDSP